MATVQELAAQLKQNSFEKLTRVPEINGILMYEDVLTDWEWKFLQDMKWKYETMPNLKASEKQLAIIDDLKKNVASRYDAPDPNE